MNNPFTIRPNLLPPTDPRYIVWRKSLVNRNSSWSKDKTKETDARLRKMSETFKVRKIDNFKKWRNIQYQKGVFLNNPKPLFLDSDLSQLIGLVIGDGHIQAFPRTEKLSVTLDTKYPNLIENTALLFKKVFNKEPKILKQLNTNCVQVYIYQKYISERIGVPTGNKKHIKRHIPNWIWNERDYLIACLKGLFEAEGSLSIHLPTSTYNFAFSNFNKYLLKEVEDMLVILGLHPEIRPHAIRLRKESEVKYFKELINFQKYLPGR